MDSTNHNEADAVDYRSQSDDALSSTVQHQDQEPSPSRSNSAPLSGDEPQQHKEDLPKYNSQDDIDNDVIVGIYNGTDNADGSITTSNTDRHIAADDNPNHIDSTLYSQQNTSNDTGGSIDAADHNITTQDVAMVDSTCRPDSRSRGRYQSRSERDGDRSRDRDGDRSRDKGGDRDGDRGGDRSGDREARQVETLEISDEDASFILGSGGRTKRKLSLVCGAELNITSVDGKTVLEINGTRLKRARAKLYVSFVMQQRVGPVHLDFEPADRDDLTCIKVPHECVGYVTGQRGQGLRSIEKEWSTLMFFTDLRSKEVGETEKLAIFGADVRARRGAELKVMSAVEQKMPGYFTREVGDNRCEEKGFGTDTAPIKESDYSYALGKMGSTRKKLARASGSILEYVGRIAFMAGTKIQRTRAREYLEWLCAQRTSCVHVVTEDRDDCTVVDVPSTCVAYVTGTKGNVLRQIEDQTGTFIFLDGARNTDAEVLFIFGENANGRVRANELVKRRIDDKLSGRSRNMGRRGGHFSHDHRRPHGGRSRSHSPRNRWRSRSPAIRGHRSRSRSISGGGRYNGGGGRGFKRDGFRSGGGGGRGYGGGRDDYWSRDSHRSGGHHRYGGGGGGGGGRGRDRNYRSGGGGGYSGGNRRRSPSPGAPSRSSERHR
eukprot:Lankesteria_metandrocarpae@DN3462_c0_g1_i1.p1